MFDIECEKCGALLRIDEKATIDSYQRDMDYLVDDVGEIIESSIQDYLVYRCIGCGSTYNFTYKDWESKYRKYIAKEAMEVRKQKMFGEEINVKAIDPDNGIEFCGQCSGYSGDGYCLVDIIKQCTIRKDK